MSPTSVQHHLACSSFDRERKLDTPLCLTGGLVALMLTLC